MLSLRLGLQMWFYRHMDSLADDESVLQCESMEVLVVWIPVYQETERKQTFILDWILTLLACVSHSILEKCILVQVNDTWRIFFLLYIFFFFTLG